MRAHRTVRKGPLALLLHGVVGERLPKAMLAEPHGLRNAILEPDHVVLPVADVVADHHAHDGVAEVERVEVHVVGIHQTRTMIIDDDGAAGGAVRLAGAIGRDAVEPAWVGRHVVDGGEVDLFAAESEGVEVVEVVQGQRGRHAGDRGEVGFRPCIDQLGADIARHILFCGVEPYQWSYIQASAYVSIARGRARAYHTPSHSWEAECFAET